ncbi:MAG: hypothetical protein JKX91_06605 [Rhizobiaceae bacterium]|nr:hypothetical protein [Rhizobiaceae bacterium]
MDSHINDAIKLCQIIELIAPNFGCHVALTGGCLYKEGARKDIDVLMYRIRQVQEIDMDGLWRALSLVGIEKISGFGWCYKASWLDKQVDVFFPESKDGEYNRENIEVAEIPHF